MMQLFLEASDVWLFRDGKPFDAFSDHRALTFFPPFPSVMQGAIRSHHLVVRKVDLRDKNKIEAEVGTANDYKHLRMRGPFIAQMKDETNVIRYFPIPADTTLEKEHGHQFRSLSLKPISEGVLTSVPSELSFLLWSQGDPKKGDFNQWLSESELLRCLAGETVTAVPSNKLFERENRFGIGRDDLRRTTKEGALYEVEFVRPCTNFGLWIEVNGYEDWPQEGLLRIGGEGHGAIFKQMSSPLPWPAIPDPLPDRFNVYFATPTYFEGGWLPLSWDKFFDGKVTLRAVALNRYHSIGGFDLARGKQKPARRYVPAGSVYYFECDERARLKPGLVQNSITDLGAEIGFGQIIIAEWEEA